jgi:hypothetical protein
MDFTGRPIQGFVYVGCPGFEADRDLCDWVTRGVACAASLPAKKTKKKRGRVPAPSRR